MDELNQLYDNIVEKFNLLERLNFSNNIFEYIYNILNSSNINPFLNLKYRGKEVPFTIFFVLENKRILEILNIPNVKNHRLNYPNFFLQDKYRYKYYSNDEDENENEAYIIKHLYKDDPDYKKYEILGKGEFGYVRIIYDINTLIPYAIKTIDLYLNRNIKSSFGEAKILKNLAGSANECLHPNVICEKDTYAESGNLYIITKLIEGPTLYDFLKDYKLNIYQKENIIIKLLEGLKFIHSKGITNNDIKIDNVIMDINNNNNPIIIDFGLACDSEITPKNKISLNNCNIDGVELGFSDYISPEKAKIHMEMHYSDSNLYMVNPEKSDIWAMGLVFYKIINNIFMIEEYHKIDYTFTPWEKYIIDNDAFCSGSKVHYMLNNTNISEEEFINLVDEYEFIDTIINLMLIKNPTERPTATELLNMLINKNIPTKWENKIDCEMRLNVPYVQERIKIDNLF